MLVILVWAKYFAPKPPVQSPQTSRQAQTSPVAPGSSGAAAPSSQAPATPDAATAVAPASAPPRSDSQERTIVVENALYRVEFSNRGAVVKSWQLKNYMDDAKPQRVLDVVHAEASQQTGGWPFALVLDDEQLQNAANNGLYRAWVSEPGATAETHAQNYATLPPNPLKAPTELELVWS